MIYLTLSGGSLWARYNDRKDIITSVDGLITLMRETGIERVSCSSSLDHPEEYTSDPSTIALCEQLRSDSPLTPDSMIPDRLHPSERTHLSEMCDELGWKRFRVLKSHENGNGVGRPGYFRLELIGHAARNYSTERDLYNVVKTLYEALEMLSIRQ